MVRMSTDSRKVQRNGRTQINGERGSGRRTSTKNPRASTGKKSAIVKGKGESRDPTRQSLEREL